MEKKIVQDVLPPEQKTIRKVTPVRKRAPALDVPLSVPPTSTQTAPRAPQTEQNLLTKKRQPNEAYREFINAIDNSVVPPLPPKPHRLGKKKWWVLAPALFVVLFFAISFVFESAVVEISAKAEKVNVNIATTAGTEGEDVIPFEVMTISANTSKSVATAGEEKVEKKASGKIVIFNKHSASSQKLVANTRFQTASGLIYRISQAVTIPGYTTKAGEVIPGSVTATVVADATGDKYNIDKTDFTVPGFEGDPRFKTIFARSETPMQGGFSGTIKKIAPDVLAAAEKEMEIKLKSDLLASAASQIPEEFILYADTAQFTYEEIAQTDTTNNATTLNYRGTMTGLLLNRKSLDERLAQETITKASAGEVQTTNLEELSVSFADPKTIVSESATSFDLKITGDAQYLWNVKKDEIAHDLAGKPKNSLGTVLSSHPAIEKAKVTLHPFWKRSFPNNASKIEILTGTQ